MAWLLTGLSAAAERAAAALGTEIEFFAANPFNPTVPGQSRAC